MAEETTHKGSNSLNLSKETVAGGGVAYVASKINPKMQDGFHFVHSAEAVRTGAAAHHTFHGFSSLGSTIVSNLGGFLAIAAGASVSAYLNHLVHRHHEKTLLDRYRPQVATWFGKDKKAVTVEDLHTVSKDVPGIGEELERNRSMRNLRTVAVVTASTLAFAAVFVAASTLLAPLGAAAAAAGLFSWAGLGFISASMAVSLTVLNVATKGIVNFGKKLFGYDKPNVEDHVDGLANLVKDDKPLTPEKVMGVFVAASPDMQKQIEEAFGSRYDTLSHENQVKAEQMFGNHLPLEKLSEAINKGDVSPRELMFVAHEQSSEAIAAIMGKHEAPAETKKEAHETEPEHPQQIITPIKPDQWRNHIKNERQQASFELVR